MEREIVLETAREGVSSNRFEFTTLKSNRSLDLNHEFLQMLKSLYKRLPNITSLIILATLNVGNYSFLENRKLFES